MGVESRLRAQRKSERKRRKAEMPRVPTPRGLSRALAVATVTNFLLAACGPNEAPPEQFNITMPPFLNERFEETLTVIPEHLIQNINLTRCPPDVTISNAQLATAVIGFNPATGEVTFTITPQENVEGLVGVTAHLKAIGQDGTSCVVAGIATGSAEVDTKATNCTQSGFAGNTAQVTCDGPGTISANGISTPIVNGAAGLTISDEQGQVAAQVDDGHGNTSQVTVAIGANCNVAGEMKFDSTDNQYEVPVSCTSPASLTSDLNNQSVAVPQANQAVDVPVRGGDGAHTLISAVRNGFTTHLDFNAPVTNQAPQVFVAGIYIRNGKIVLDDIACQQTVLNAPCLVNGSQIAVGTSTDVAVGPAVLGPGGNTINVTVNDPAGRYTTSQFTQPYYNPFEGVQAFFGGLQDGSLRIAISTEGDTTESIVNIALSGTQQPPFSQDNWLHELLEYGSSGVVECTTQKVTNTQWMANCDVPHNSFLGQDGEFGPLTMTMTESNGVTQKRDLDVYALTPVMGAPEPLIRPTYPNVAERVVDAGGIMGILASIAGVGSMGVLTINKMVERVRRNNLDDALNILLQPATDPEFVMVGNGRDEVVLAGYSNWMEQYINGSTNALSDVILKGKRPIEDIPTWAKEDVREIWKRKKQAIQLIHTPTTIRQDSTKTPIFNGGVLLDTLESYGKRNKKEEEFNEKMQRLPQEKSKFRNAQLKADNDRRRALRDIWLHGLDEYLEKNIIDSGEGTTLNQALLSGKLPEVAVFLLERSEKSQIWSLITENGTRFGLQRKELTHLTRKNLVAILCAHLIETNFRQYLRYKDVIKRELNIGRDKGRSETEAIIRQKFQFID